MGDFSGYLAIDEIYDGPFCVLYAVDPHRQRRVAYRILDPDAVEDDVRAFVTDLKKTLDDRDLRVRGVTTDGSPLYPTVLKEVFPEATHPLCVFHVLKNLNRKVLDVLARLRKGLIPPRRKRRGRPSKAQKRRDAAWVKRRRADLFDHRHLWVKRHLTPGEQRELARLCRGNRLLSALRRLVDLVYTLFDRRCRASTARRKLAVLRRHGLFRAFPDLAPIARQLRSHRLEQALEFLDDRLLEATSNSVERANRRHRKMQKGIYRVRTLATLDGRIKLDLLRDMAHQQRRSLLAALHADRRR